MTHYYRGKSTWMRTTDQKEETDMRITLTDKHKDAANATELAGEIYDTLLSRTGQGFIPKPHLADAIRQIATGYRVEPFHIPEDMTITGGVLEVSK